MGLWLSFCLLVSGAAALVYEIAWLRLLSLTLGNTAFATSCIIAIFLGGLAIGAFIGGRLADRKNFAGLGSYGAVEVAIGLLAPITTLLLKAAPYAVAHLCKLVPNNAVFMLFINILTSCALLLPATVLMGATLPLVMKFAESTHKQTQWFSWLYGINTLGAVIGSFSAAVLGFAYLGITTTTFVAGAGNVLIGIGNLALGKRVCLDQAPASAAVLQPADTSKRLRDEFLFLLGVLSLLTGFTSVSYEVLWARMLRFFIGSSTYAFSIVLGTFLLGLAAGSILYRFRLLSRDSTTEQRLVRFANLQYLASISSAGSLLAVPVALLIHINNAHPLVNPWPSMAQTAVLSFVIVFLPSMLIGTLFPLLGTIASERQNGVASAIGRVYAFNTIGCVLGSIITGMCLMPAFGSYRAFQISLILSVLTGSIAIVKAGSSRKLIILGSALPVVLALAFITFVYFPYSHFLTVPGGSIIASGEDAIGAMLILDFPKADIRQLVFNGSCLATTAMPSRRYMRLLGHLPILLHNDPHDVLVACFGTGTTCGAACVHPGIKSVDLVELSSMILKSGDYFSSSNYSVLHSPKLHATIGDARNYLLLSDKKYDIITFEPPPPCDVGIVNLYTTDFYRLASEHLRPGGLMCQWVPLHDASERLWKMQVKTAQAVFPYVSVWLPNSGEALLMCGLQAPSFNLAQMEKRIHAGTSVTANMHEIGIDSAADLLAAFVADGGQLEKFAAGTDRLLTDDRPALEFYHPYAGPLIEDSTLFNLDGIKQKAFDSDAKVQSCKTALGLCFKPSSSQPDRLNLLRQALTIEPNNQWFEWLLKQESSK